MMVSSDRVWKRERRGELDALDGFLVEWEIADNGSSLTCGAHYRGRMSFTLEAKPSGWYVVGQGGLRGPYALRDAIREGIESYLASYLGFCPGEPTLSPSLNKPIDSSPLWVSCLSFN